MLKFNLTKELAGVFECVSENSAGKISKSVTIGYNGEFGLVSEPAASKLFQAKKGRLYCDAFLLDESLQTLKS